MNPRTPGAWRAFDRIRPADAAERVRGVVRRTPLVPLACDDARIELRGKLENRQETGSFKARGAWNQVAQLTPEQRARGIVTSSSGNHGKALAWAAERAGVKATICMPANAYPNKIEACRAHGAEVVLSETRDGAERACDERAAAGATLVHPYDAERTLEGAGTVGLEIAEDWPEVDVVVVCVGGGGLVSGSSLALRQTLGERVAILGAEPAGAPSLARGVAARKRVELETIDTKVQGLCPLYSGQINVDVCSATLDGIELVSDAEIFAAQERLVAAGETVEPAGAAAMAVVVAGKLPRRLLDEAAKRGERLRVAVVISGGNPDPAQLEAVRARVGARPAP
jgi:threonine dehydratase